MTLPNQSPEPTAVGACSSAVAVHIISPACLYWVVRHRTTLMKTFTTILLLAAVLSISHMARAADSSLELVLSDDHVVFTTVTNISMAMIFRNVGETNLAPYKLLVDLSVVLDGKAYQRDPKRIIVYNGVLWFQPRTGWRDHVSLSDYLIPPEALASGRHTVTLRDAAAESNTQTIFIE